MQTFFKVSLRFLYYAEKTTSQNKFPQAYDDRDELRNNSTFHNSLHDRKKTMRFVVRSVYSAFLYISFLHLTYLPGRVLQGTNKIRKLHKYNTKIWIETRTIHSIIFTKIYGWPFAKLLNPKYGVVSFYYILKTW